MEELIKRLQLIHDKVNALKLENKQLKSELTKSEKQLQRLKQIIDIQNSTLQQQEQQLKIKTIATQLVNDQPLSPNESRALKQKINEMIKEVDKVIALIHE
ncbi:MAG: hypothetical protein V4613_00605 [Bacteroidota bacterium]